MAARLAQHGFTASPQAIDGPQGYLAAMDSERPASALAEAIADLGVRWEILETGISVKLYPSCAATHPPLDALLELVRRHGFSAEDVDAIDVVVRGIKSGLPLGDSLRVIATDSPEPIRSEFRNILETQAVGLPLGEACAKLFDRIPLAEANFFAIVISIQQKSGGNLSEALGNLSKVLRERKKMKGKIKAMSTEATASAGIIGALPIVVMVVVYLTSPDYITLLWTERLGQIMRIGRAVGEQDFLDAGKFRGCLSGGLGVFAGNQHMHVAAERSCRGQCLVGGVLDRCVVVFGNQKRGH